MIIEAFNKQLFTFALYYVICMFTDSKVQIFRLFYVTLYNMSALYYAYLLTYYTMMQKSSHWPL